MIPRRISVSYPGQLRDLTRYAIGRAELKSEEITDFEKKFADFIGVRHAIATSTGRKAMEIIFDFLEIGRGDEIIIPAYTLHELIPLLQSRAITIRFADIELESYGIDAKDVEKKITKKTKLIMATHLFGLPCDLDPILKLSEEHNIPVVEDCAHSSGSKYNGKRVGSFGKAGFFSFQRIKPINTFGGGMVTTNDDTLADNARRLLADYTSNGLKIVIQAMLSEAEDLVLRSPLMPVIARLFTHQKTRDLIARFYLGMQDRTRETEIAYHPLQAMMGSRQLERLDDRIKEMDRLAGLLMDKLDPRLVIPRVPEGRTSTWYFFIVRSPLPAKEARKILVRHGIDVAVESEITDDCASLFNHELCPNTGEAYKYAIQVPLFIGMSLKTIDKIAEAVNSLLV